MVNDYYDGRLPVEVTDMFLHQLDSVIEHDNRTIGNQQMQHRVLQWAITVKDMLPASIREGLISCMERQLEQMKAERPSVAEDSFRAIRQVNAEREGKS